jgi:hypothetical protein
VLKPEGILATRVTEARRLKILNQATWDRHHAPEVLPVVVCSKMARNSPSPRLSGAELDAEEVRDGV